MPFARLVLPVIVLLLFSPAVAAEALRIVATVPDLAAIARDVGGDQVSVRSMSVPGQDPHFVDARPDLALSLAGADYLLYVGMDLEAGWLPTLRTGARNPRVSDGGEGAVDCSTFVPLLEGPSGVSDRSAGDLHPGGNPHYLRDPRLGVLVAQGLAEVFARARPSEAVAFRTRAALLAAGVGELEARLAGARAELAGVPVLGWHRSWSYLVRWLSVRWVGEIEPKPGIPPGPAHVASIIERAKTEGVRIILQEDYYPARLAEAIAERSGAKLVRVTDGADFDGGAPYLERFEALIQRIAGASR